MPVASGSCVIRAGSVPAMQAAVVTSSPAAALEVTYDASASSRPAMRSPTFRCSSSSRQNRRLASRMTSNTSGAISDPP